MTGATGTTVRGDEAYDGANTVTGETLPSHKPLYLLIVISVQSEGHAHNPSHDTRVQDLEQVRQPTPCQSPSPSWQRLQTSPYLNAHFDNIGDLLPSEHDQERTDMPCDLYAQTPFEGFSLLDLQTLDDITCQPSPGLNAFVDGRSSEQQTNEQSPTMASSSKIAIDISQQLADHLCVSLALLLL